MKHVGTQPIETQRLLLRRFVAEDAEAMYATWASDAEVARWMRWAPHQNLEETHAVLEGWVAAYAKPNNYHWALVLKEDGRLIGSLGIFPEREPGNEDAWTVGYNIGRAYWNHGYTTEALQAALHYFVQNTGNSHLVCCHAVENAASGRVMEKAGFVYHHNGSYQRLDGSEVPAKHYVYQPR